jgi:hypothetical protein
VPVPRRAMEKTIERYAIKFCAKLNKSLADTHQMIQEVSRWLKLFKNGREEALDGRQPAKVTKMFLVFVIF